MGSDDTHHVALHAFALRPGLPTASRPLPMSRCLAHGPFSEQRVRDMAQPVCPHSWRGTEGRAPRPDICTVPVMPSKLVSPALA